MNVHKYCRAGSILPWTLITLFFLDVLFRFIPLSTLGFHGPQSASRKSFSVIGPFTPNIRISTNSSFGDLANLGNLPKMRIYRSSSFTTDSYGFNNPFPSRKTPQVIFLGDSFALPSDVPENRTFASQLADLQGSGIFNAGGVLPLRLVPLRNLAHQLEMKSGYVLYEFLERHLNEVPPVSVYRGTEFLPSLRDKIAGIPWWEKIRLPLWNYVEFSPLQTLAQEIDKSLCNDIILPNRYSQNVLIRRLKNGDNLLFLARDLESQKVTVGQVAAWADYFGWYSSQLKQDGLTLVVLLIPNKYSVYAPSFAFPENITVNESNLRKLQTLLTKKQISVVNLWGPFHAQAAADMDQHLYLYWNDDTHWNERGMTIAARQVAAALARQDLANY